MKVKSYIKSIFSGDSKYSNRGINKKELASVKQDGMMLTVGLDFGTHQTKVCIESKGGVELTYTFVKFMADANQSYYTLPSIIGVGKNKKLSYGYLPANFDGQIIRYFKQGAFRTTSPDRSMTQELAMYYSVWYIAYILFDLEEVFGQNFTIQMGAPTDSSHVSTAKQIATRIIASAYKLVEEVFESDKQKFLDSNYEQLIEKTELVAYSTDVKEEYGLLVFPEAYACLKPLISQKKIATGMSLMVDIGGGTTDISFFTIENGVPQVYDFFSLNKGLNYLTCADERIREGNDSNVKDQSEIDNHRRSTFTSEINNVCFNIRNKLLQEFKRQTSLRQDRLLDALKNRPLVYCGGGSTFPVLRVTYAGYKDMKQMSEKEWNTKSMEQIAEIIDRGLCPILSTAYGLAISTEHDDIKMKPFRDIFEGVRGAEEQRSQSENRWSTFGEAYGGFNYADDWDAWK
ncbi:MAG: hypothetical protein SPE17_07910 [Alloprevotella sp.]|nr:hypothetical protein [Alloprevotella sp.]